MRSVRALAGIGRPPVLETGRTRAVRPIASLVVVATALGACAGGGSADETADPFVPVSGAAEGSMSAPPVEGGQDAAGDEADGMPNPSDATGASTDPEVGPRLAAARERCTVAFAAMERRIDEERFEWPDEAPEPTEEELQRTLKADYVSPDGVAAPEERPVIETMPAFDPETAPIPELDRLVGECLERGIVDEVELFGEEELDDGAWCDELTALSPDDLTEFADDEGADVVSLEFEECGLGDPFST